MWVRFWKSAERQIHPEARNAGSLHLCNGGAWRTWHTPLSGNDCSRTYHCQLTHTHTDTTSNDARSLLHCLEMGVFFSKFPVPKIHQKTLKINYTMVGQRTWPQRGIRLVDESAEGHLESKPYGFDCLWRFCVFAYVLLRA